MRLATRPRAAATDPAQLARLVGRYQLAPHFALTVAHEGDHLFVQATDQARLRIFAASPWRYFYKIVDAQLTFEPGADSRAARVILHQHGEDHAGARVE